MKLPVVLFVPNLLGYGRIILALIGLSVSVNNPVSSIMIWLFSAFLDLIDGMLARKLHQTSQLGIFLDIAADNILRTAVWVAAILSSSADPIVTVTGCFIISLEWFTMVCTQLHAAQFEKHWKSDRESDPWLVRQVFKNGFKAPLGILTIHGLFFVQMWFYAKSHPVVYNNIPLFDFWMYLAVVGRVLGMVVEFWLCKGFLQVIIQRDEAVIKARRRRSRPVVVGGNEGKKE